MFNFFKKKEPQTPSFIESIDDYTHLKIVRLKGYLDSSTMSEVQSFIRISKKKGSFLNKSVLLDLKNVAHVDSSVIAGLVRIFSELKQKKFKFGLVNVPDNLKGMLEIMKLENIFLVFESEKKAFNEILAWSEEWK